MVYLCYKVGGNKPPLPMKEPEMTATAFQAETNVQIKSSGKILTGKVVSSNDLVTVVEWFSPVLNKTVIRSWVTRSVKLATA